MTNKKNRYAKAWLALTAVALSGGLSACSDNDHDGNTNEGSGSPVAGRTAVVDTTAGPVQGRVQDNVDEFLGIPYATPPLAELRWRPPQPHEPWADTLDAVAFGNTCAQTLTLGVFAARSDHEDCLFLNVFAPADRSPDSGLPVMIWMHGGAILAGGSNDYDGSKLADDGNMIVVTINNRMNVFGFLG